MKTVWKYQLDFQNTQSIEIPMDSTILCVQAQDDRPCAWVLVDPDEKRMTSATFEIYGTGHQIERVPENYLGTFQVMSGKLVFHVFVHEPPTKGRRQ